MLKLSYNTNGLRNMPLESAINLVAKYSYSGVELSLNNDYFHPFNTPLDKLQEIKNVLKKSGIKPVCLATGDSMLLSTDPYEPSLVSLHENQRQERINLIIRAIEIAKILNIPIVNFASGFRNSSMDSNIAREYLIEGIKKCLSMTEDIILAIEPEPDMFIETTSEAKEIIERINDERFRLNLDIGHVVCCENNIIDSINNVAPYICHVHIEDIKGKVHHHEIPGEGDINLKEVLDLLKSIDYDGYISVELYHHVNIAEKALSSSYKYLVNII